MTYTNALKIYKQKAFETETGKQSQKELADDWGVQFRNIKGQKTFATAYFYSSQNSTLSEFRALQQWMRVNGFELTQTSDIDFEGQSFPKTSWARITYTVEKLATP